VVLFDKVLNAMGVELFIYNVWMEEKSHEEGSTPLNRLKKENPKQ